MKIGSLTVDKPIVLAPMEAVTEQAFRLICKKWGAEIVYTEFISSQGLINKEAFSIQKTAIHEAERPIGIQIYGNQVETMVQAAQLAEKMKPDFLDINYGCPAKSIAGKGAGSGLLCNPELMEAITRSVVNAVHIPVTAKTRIGWNHEQIHIVEMAQMLENCGIQALTIHGRTRAQKFQGQANWEWIHKAKQSVKIPVIGNGDVCTPEDVKAMFVLTGCDGVMIGRGALGNPWIFQRSRHYMQTGEQLPFPSLQERIEVLLEHLSLSIALKGQRRGIIEMGKHYTNYLVGIANMKQLRGELHHMTSYEAIRNRLYLLGNN